MSVEFIGMIAVRYASESRPAMGPVIDIPYTRQFAQAYEKAGSDCNLVAHHSTCIWFSTILGLTFQIALIGVIRYVTILSSSGAFPLFPRWSSQLLPPVETMPSIHLRLAGRAAAAWTDAVELEKEVALRRAAEIIVRECAARRRAVPSTFAYVADLPSAAMKSAIEKAPGRYREAVRTLAGCLLSEETQSSAAIDLTFFILDQDPPTKALRQPSRNA